MAAISISNSFCTKNSFAHEPHLIKNVSRTLIFSVSCQSVDPLNRQKQDEEEEEKKRGKGVLSPLLAGVQKFGNGLRDSLSPKKKGDWKDLTLMSLSFAVYVYMSQKIVCAYCAYMSLLQHSW